MTKMQQFLPGFDGFFLSNLCNFRGENGKGSIYWGRGCLNVGILYLNISHYLETNCVVDTSLSYDHSSKERWGIIKLIYIDLEF